MSRLRILAITMIAISATAALAAGGQPEANYGQPLKAADLAGMFSIPPSGAGLPLGQGTPVEGHAVYANACAACHGEKLEGIKPTGAPALIGGRGSLATPKPFKTVESYWPYVTTVFDYVKRAMPFNAPGSLSDDQVYAVTAYILAQGHIIAPTAIINAATLPKVQMPNAKGFIPDPRPH
jgi:cytochrome c